MRDRLQRQQLLRHGRELRRCPRARFGKLPEVRDLRALRVALGAAGAVPGPRQRGPGPGRLEAGPGGGGRRALAEGAGEDDRGRHRAEAAALGARGGRLHEPHRAHGGVRGADVRVRGGHPPLGRGGQVLGHHQQHRAGGDREVPRQVDRVTGVEQVHLLPPQRHAAVLRGHRRAGHGPRAVIQALRRRRRWQRGAQRDTAGPGHV
mmetsp:Transcript_54301/g.174091  ORF Transcript_54301/g.174091 Transcript_54301/m.174091 type:complete len:206 (+) Transcript_54301:1443-2060(+)